jgi:hypothetical protein
MRQGRRLDALKHAGITCGLKFFTLSLLLFLMLFQPMIAFPAPPGKLPLAGGHRLPPDWQARAVIDKKLTGATGQAGRWETFELRSPSGELVFLQFLSEEGAGKLFIPVLTGPLDDGSLGMGATYNVSSAGSFRAICETHPYLGFVVTAALPSGGTVVLESKSLSIERLLGLCSFLLDPPPAEEFSSEPIFVIP